MAAVSITAVPLIATGSLAGGLAVVINAVPFTATANTGGTVTPFVYVVDAGNHQIDVFDYDGVYKFSFGSYGSGNGQFINPYDVTSDGEYVWVTDSGNNRVQKFTLYGVYVAQFGNTGSADGQFETPKGIVVDERFLYVVDQNNHRVQVFNPINGSFVFAFGSYGSGDLQFNAPTDISTDALYLYIDDTGNGRIVTVLKSWLAVGNYGGGALSSLTLGSGAQGDARCAYGKGMLPVFELSTPGATGKGGGVGRGIAVIPGLTLYAQGRVERHGNGTCLLPAWTLNAHGFPGGVGTGAGILPAFILTAVGHQNGVGSGAVVLPALIISATGYMTPAIVNYFGIVTNMRNKAITEYTAFAFNSFAMIAGKVYGANDTGIYLLEGSDDNGVDIDAHFRSGTDDLHKDVVRRLDDFYLVWRADGDAQLTVIEDEDDQTVYELSDSDDKIHETRDTFAKGHRGRMVAVEFANVAGADFDLHEMHIKDRAISKRRR